MNSNVMAPPVPRPRVGIVSRGARAIPQPSAGKQFGRPKQSRIKMPTLRSPVPSGPLMRHDPFGQTSGAMHDPFGQTGG